MQRGHDKQAIFFDDRDYLRYLTFVREAIEETQCRLHAYVLMTNHVHLLVTPSEPSSVPALMKRVGQRHTQYVNWRYQRTGTLWEGRYKALLLEREERFLTCQRYIELNPVRARMVAFPGHYAWSSYRCNAEGRFNPLITPHERYLLLADDVQTRRQAYMALFAQPFTDEELGWLRL